MNRVMGGSSDRLRSVQIPSASSPAVQATGKETCRVTGGRPAASSTPLINCLWGSDQFRRELGVVRSPDEVGSESDGRKALTVGCEDLCFRNGFRGGVVRVSKVPREGCTFIDSLQVSPGMNHGRGARIDELGNSMSLASFQDIS
jgi:hypothetical protein